MALRQPELWEGIHCLWEEDVDGVWYSSCDQAWCSETGGTPAEHNYRYCPFCGEEILAQRYADPYEEDL